MADFCWKCTEDKMGVEGHLNDFAGVITKEQSDAGDVADVLCEGCGPIFVNHEGKKVDKP